MGDRGCRSLKSLRSKVLIVSARNELRRKGSEDFATKLTLNCQGKVNNT